MELVVVAVEFVGSGGIRGASHFPAPPLTCVHRSLCLARPDAGQVTGLGTLHAAQWYTCAYRDCFFPVVCQPADIGRLPLGRPEAHGALGICTNWKYVSTPIPRAHAVYLASSLFISRSARRSGPCAGRTECRVLVRAGGCPLCVSMLGLRCSLHPLYRPSFPAGVVCCTYNSPW